MPTAVEAPRGFAPLFRGFYKHAATGVVVAHSDGEESGWRFVNVTEPEFRDVYLAETNQPVNVLKDFELYWKLYALPKKKNYVVVADPDVKEVLNKRVVVCSGCSQFCGSSAAGPTYKDHYKASTSCVPFKYDQFECSGAWLNSTTGRRRVFVVTDTRGNTLKDNVASQEEPKDEELPNEAPQNPEVINLLDEESDDEISPPQAVQPQKQSSPDNKEATQLDKSTSQDKEPASSEGDSESTLVEPEMKKVQEMSRSSTPSIVSETINKRVANDPQNKPSSEPQPQRNSEEVKEDTEPTEFGKPVESQADDQKEKAPAQEQPATEASKETPQPDPQQREASAIVTIAQEAVQALITASTSIQATQNENSPVYPTGGEADSPINESVFFDPVRELSPTYNEDNMMKGDQVDYNAQTIDPSLLTSDSVTPTEAKKALEEEEAMLSQDNDSLSEDSDASEDDSIVLLSIEAMGDAKKEEAPRVRTRRSSQAFLFENSARNEQAKPATKPKGSTTTSAKKTKKVQPKDKKNLRSKKAPETEEAPDGPLPPFPRIIVNPKYRKSNSPMTQTRPSSRRSTQPVTKDKITQPAAKDKSTIETTPVAKRTTRLDSLFSSPQRPQRHATIHPNTNVVVLAKAAAGLQKKATSKPPPKSPAKSPAKLPAKSPTKAPTKPLNGKRATEEPLINVNKTKKAKKSTANNDKDDNDACAIPFPSNHTDSNFDVETWKAMSVSFEIFRKSTIDSIDNALLDNISQHPQVVKAYENYFKNVNAYLNVLPYVLLDCLTDDFWNADDEIRDNFRFTLTAGDSPLLFVYNDSTEYSFPVTIGLKNEGGHRGWSFTFKVDMSNNLTTSRGGIGHSYNISVEDLDYDGVCEMLMVYIVMTYTVLYRLVNQLDVLETAQLCQFISQAFEKVRSGEVATRLIDEKLYSHIARWKN